MRPEYEKSQQLLAYARNPRLLAISLSRSRTHWLSKGPPNLKVDNSRHYDVGHLERI